MAVDYTDIPDQTITEGETFLTINLDDYVTDIEDHDSLISWSYSGNNELSVTITDRVATIGIPTVDWNGAETITFTAEDTGLLTDSDAAVFTVLAASSRLAAGSGNRLFECVARQKAEEDRQAVANADFGQRQAYGSIDVLVVRGLAPNHRAKANHSRIIAAGCQPGGGRGKLKSPRHPNNVDLLVGYAVGRERFDGAFEQARGD